MRPEAYLLSHEQTSSGVGLGVEFAVTQSILLDLALHYEGVGHEYPAPGGALLAAVSGLGYRF